MAWTYSGNPDTNDVDALRFTIQDTLADDPQFQDEELAYVLEQRGSVRAAAIAAVDVLVARYARQADRTMGQTSISASQRAEAYRKLRDDLEAAPGKLLVAPSAPAVHKATRAEYATEGGLVEPYFTRDPERYRRTR